MEVLSKSIHDVPSLPGEYWQWRGEQVYYVKAGVENPTKPPLLLVHGFGASTDHWRKNIHILKENYQVWAIDLMGFGRSGKPPWEYNGILWRQQLNDFIQEKNRKTHHPSRKLPRWLCLPLHRCRVSG